MPRTLIDNRPRNAVKRFFRRDYHRARGRRARLGFEEMDRLVLLSADPATALSTALNNIGTFGDLTIGPGDGMGKVFEAQTVQVPWNGMPSYGGDQNTTTTTTEGTTTTTDTTVVSNSSDGSTSTVDYSWTEDSTGTNPDGSTFSDHIHTDEHYSLTASDNGDGSTSYSVTDNEDQDWSDTTTGGDNPNNLIQYSGNEQTTFSCTGQQDASGNVSGSFTETDNLTKSYTVHAESGTDSSGAAIDPVNNAGFSLDYTSQAWLNDSESGDLTVDANNQESTDEGSYHDGNVALWYGDGTTAYLDGYSLGELEDTQETFDGSQSPASGPLTQTGTPTGTGTPLPLPRGKNVIYLVDSSDKGWADWTPDQRQAYINQNPNLGLNPNSPNPITGGQKFWSALIQPGSINQSVNSLNDAVTLLEQETGNNPADAVIIADHGSEDGQNIGDPNSEGDWIGPDYPQNNNQAFAILSCIKNGGSLVMTGCNVFGSQDSIDWWQGMADLYEVYITGSVSETNWTVGQPPQGQWITLVPGGPEPTYPQPPPQH